ncbi:MAG: tetratricopeptide repeat protein, partial [Planctomycetota bacterium]|nr:tetratricopeptide repeat protein [Planctomycetota bacterium]
GEGAMGKVLSATDPEIGRPVAIKILHPDRESHWRGIAKFRREAQITGRLDHPNIVPVYDMGPTPDGSYYFVMKQVSGRSLAEELREIRRFMRGRPERYDGIPMLGAFLKICDAMAFAHSRRIIHRDLKPGNFMIGSFGEVLVMDWGLAKDLSEAQEDPGLERSFREETRKIESDDLGFKTKDGMILGTPAYMPPEQAAGKIEEIDERSDLYSLGATLYEILTLFPPFLGKSAVEVLARVQNTSLVPPSVRNPEANVPRELEAVVLKAMASDPKLRYVSITDLQADIEAYREGRTLSAAEYSWVQRVRKWIGRHQAVSAVTSLALLGFVCFFTVSNLMDSRRTEEAFREAVASAKRLCDEVGEMVVWESAELEVDPDTGLVKREGPEEKKSRERAIRNYLEAASRLEKALELRPRREEVRRERARIGRAIGQMAMVGRDGLLAREAFRRLSRYGENSESVAKLLASVDAMETEVLDWRRKRLERILADLALGLNRADRPLGSPLLEDYVLEAVRYRDPQTLRILAENLRELIAKAEEGIASDSKPVWQQPERDRAKFVCEVLGRLELPGCVAPLTGWLDVVDDPQLAVAAGVALCNTRDANAQPHLLAARDRFGINSFFWKQVRQYTNRLPGVDLVVDSMSLDQLQKLAQIQADRGEHRQAVETYTRILESRSDERSSARAFRVNLHANRGTLHYQMSNLDAALGDFNEAIRLNPRWGRIYNNRGLVFMKRKSYEAALADFNKAIEFDPEDAAATVNRGNLLLEIGNLEAALRDYNRAIEINPNDLMIYNNRGSVFSSLGELEKALADFNHILDRDPKYVRAYANRAWVFVKREDFDAAIADYSRAIELDPKTYQAYHNRGIMFREKGDLDAAIADFSQAIQVNPEFAPAYVSRGRMFMQRNELDAALENFNKAVSVDRNNVHAFTNRAQVFMKRKQLDLALQDCDRAFEIDSKNAVALDMRVQVRAEMKDYSGALVDSDRLIELDPKFRNAHNRRAFIKRKLGRHEEALGDLDTEIRLFPKSAIPYYNRGLLHKFRGRHEQAAEDFRRHLDLVPRSRFRPTIEKYLKSRSW